MSSDDNMMAEINRELDRLGAPTTQQSGFGYSPIGRLRALTASLVGKYYGATVDRLAAERDQAHREGYNEAIEDAAKYVDDVCELWRVAEEVRALAKGGDDGDS